MRSSTAGGVRGSSLTGKKSREPKFDDFVIGSIGDGPFQASARQALGFLSLVLLRRLMGATGPEGFSLGTGRATGSTVRYTTSVSRIVRHRLTAAMGFV